MSLTRVLFFRILAAAFVGWCPVHAVAEPAAVDLAALIECRSGAQAWGDLAFSFMNDPNLPSNLGWTALELQNPFLQEYDLPAPVFVFGHDTTHVAFTASGIMAVLEGVDALGLAETLGVTAGPAAPGQFLGEKVVLEEESESDGFKLRTRVSINVSTVDTHPGKTLAGCSYVIDIVDG